LKLEQVVAILGGLHLSAADAPLPAVYKSSAELMAMLKQNMQKATGGQADSPIDNQDHFRVNVVHRDKPGNAMAHAMGPAKGTEVHYIIEGSATVVTGGTIQRPSEKGATPTIEGGVTKRVSTGGVVVIPAGTPHWYKDVDGGGVTYLEVRFDVELKGK
jgi:mannose-6-phosphate isomerase-like protein (cupin superfamily)